MRTPELVRNPNFLGRAIFWGVATGLWATVLGVRSERNGDTNADWLIDALNRLVEQRGSRG